MAYWRRCRYRIWSTIPFSILAEASRWDKTRVANVGANPAGTCKPKREICWRCRKLLSRVIPTLTKPPRMGPPPQGLWGVEYEGYLVAVLSDLGLQQN